MKPWATRILYCLIGASIFCTFFILAYAEPSSSTSHELAKKHYDTARIHFRRGEYPEAKSELLKVLALEPEHQGAGWYLKLVKKELAKLEKTFIGHSQKIIQDHKKRKEVKEVLDYLDQYAQNAENLNVEKAAALTKPAPTTTAALEQKQDDQKTNQAQGELDKQTRRLAQEKELLEKDIRQQKERKLNEKIDDYLAEGKYYFKLKAYWQAQEAFNKVLELEYDHSQARKYLQKIDEEIAKEKQHRSLERRAEEERLTKMEAQRAQEQQALRLKAQGQAQKELEVQWKEEQEDQRSLEKEIRAQKEEELKSKIEIYLSSGINYFKEKEYKLAKAELEKVLDLDFTNKKAVSYLQKINAIDAKKCRAEFLAQRKEKERKNEEERKALLKEEMEKEQVRSKEEQAKKRFEENLEAEKARLAKEKVDVYLNEGSYYFKEKAYPQAKQEFEAALALDKANEQARLYLARIAGMLGEDQAPPISEAQEKEQLERVRQTNQDSISQLKSEKELSRKQFLTERKRAEQAEKAKREEEKRLAKELEIFRRAKIDIYLDQGKFYFKEKDYEKAKGEFAEALALDAYNAKAHEYMSQIEGYDAAWGQVQVADSEKGQVASPPAERLDFKAELAKLKEEKKAQRESYLEAKQAGKRQEKENVIAQKQTGEKDKAREEARLAEEQKLTRKEQIRTYLDQGAFYFSQKAYDKAKEQFKQIIALEPTHKKALNYLYKIDQAAAKQEREEFLARRRAEEEKAKEEKRLALQAKETKEQQGRLTEEEVRLQGQVQKERVTRAQQERLEEEIQGYLAKGKFLYDQKEYTDARAAFEEILALDPTHKQ
ncbi:MAG: hypothetical protein V1727_01530, partial [Candidatus Omnitrophota bacterium]